MQHLMNTTKYNNNFIYKLFGNNQKQKHNIQKNKISFQLILVILTNNI